MLESLVPVTRDVTLEGLSEDWIEFHDVLLEANKVTIQSEHVIHTLILEVLNVDSFVLLQFDQITYFMLLTDHTRLIIVERHVKSVDSNRLLLILETLVDEGIHGNDIDLAQRVTSL